MVVNIKKKCLETETDTTFTF